MEERRLELLQVGAEVFASQPFDEVWVNDVAKRAGVSTALLYHYFGSKRGLLTAILDRGWTTIEARVNAVDSNDAPVDRLLSVLEAVVVELENDSDLKNLMVLEAGRVRKDNRDVIVSQGFHHFAEVVSSILTEMRDRGQIASSLNLDAVSAAVIGMTAGLLRNQVLGQRSEFRADYSADDLRKVLGAMISAFASGRVQQPLRAVNG